MPKHFSQRAKIKIYRQIIDAAIVQFARYGIKKTNVDEICQMVGIAKGSFYNFFSSKSELTIAVIEDTEKKIKGRLFNDLKTIEGDNQTKFIKALLAAYVEVKAYPWLVHLLNTPADYHYLLRNMSNEQFENHLQGDVAYTLMILDYFHINQDSVDINLITAMLRSIFINLLHVQEIGVHQIDEVIELELRGLANYVFGGAHNDSC